MFIEGDLYFIKFSFQLLKLFKDSSVYDSIVQNLRVLNDRANLVIDHLSHYFDEIVPPETFKLQENDIDDLVDLGFYSIHTYF